MKLKFFAPILGAATVIFAQQAHAKDIDVSMKNQGSSGMMVFEPPFVQANVGDKIHFIPVDPGHNAEVIQGMVPDSVPVTAGEMNKEFVLSVAKPGLYGIRCKPHFALGMVALIKAGAGTAPNATTAAAVKLPPLAQKKMQLLLKQAR